MTKTSLACSFSGQGRRFFGNAEHYGQRIRPMLAGPRPGVVLLAMNADFDIEYTALMAMIEVEEKQRQAGSDIWLAGISPGVLATLRRSRVYDVLGKQRMFYRVADTFTAWIERRHA